MVVLNRFFSFGRQKKWSLVALDWWLSYTVTVAWEIAWVDSALVVLDEWSSYRGGHLNRFDCNMGGILLFGQKSGVSGDFLFKIYLMSKSVPAATSQNFVDTLRPQKPMWVKFLEFKLFFLSEKAKFIDIIRKKIKLGSHHLHT